MSTNVEGQTVSPNDAKPLVIGSSIQEKYDELCKEITRLQEKYDENGYDCSSIIKLQRIEQHVDMAIDIYRKNCR